ncbi:MAG TPA: hypothetical protein VIL16_22870 [Trebonia sp.]
MYAQTSEKVIRPPADATITTAPSRATLRTRPRIQRATIRSWEYIRPVRITVLVIRLLAVLWMFVLTNLLVSNGFVWGWIFLPTALATFAIALWVFTTAEKGWPVVKA